jgi:serine/threonine protein kinase
MLARRIMRQMLKGLAFCHKKGVAHLDLKLENIMISKDQKKVTLIDFGLCSVVGNT